MAANTCEECGWPTGSTDRRRKLCHICSDARTKRRNRDYRQRPTCADCGYPTPSHHYHRCEICADAHHKRYMRERHHRLMAEDPDYREARLSSARAAGRRYRERQRTENRSENRS